MLCVHFKNLRRGQSEDTVSGTAAEPQKCVYRKRRRKRRAAIIIIIMFHRQSETGDVLDLAARSR